MRVACVGAGFSGLATASTLLRFGHDVVVFDAAPDVGGVWSAKRRYPGLRAQNTGSTYAFSTLRMPEEYALHPDGEQIQHYLESYARMNKLDQEGRMRLGTKVTKATPDSQGWTLEVCSEGVTTCHRFDYLVVATGSASAPHIPCLPQAETFVSSGGSIIHSSAFHTLSDVTGKHVLVLGYGKSACDAAVAAASQAKSTTLLTKDVTWKLPTYLGGVLHYSYLLLTRLGEALFPYIRPTPAQQFFNFGLGRPIRAALLHALETVTTVQLKLVGQNLLPTKPFETIARANISLASPGFVEAVADKKITVERGSEIVSMSAGEVLLSSGKTLPADVIICGTGWSQSIPSFLPEHLTSTLLDENDDWVLYRHTLPIGIPRLAFAGFNSSLFCPLTAEISALWLAAHLESTAEAPLLSIPAPDEQERLAHEETAWMRQRTDGHHARATNIVPFSMSNIDEMLNDLDVSIGTWNWLKEWFLPVNPSAYRGLLPIVRSRRDSPQAQLSKAQT